MLISNIMVTLVQEQYFNETLQDEMHCVNTRNKETIRLYNTLHSMYMCIHDQLCIAVHDKKIHNLVVCMYVSITYLR